MDAYSRLIAWLKILLPVFAIGLLSTLFLLSRDPEPTASVPFADADIRDRVLGQQVTEPLFSGTTRSGDRLTITAATLRTEGGQIGENRAETLTAQYDTTKGLRILLTADEGLISINQSLTTLTGNVIITTSSGYRVTTDLMRAGMAQLDIEAPQTVVAHGPLGDLDAGAMQLTTPEGQESPHLIFHQGVKLIYDPETSRE